MDLLGQKMRTRVLLAGVLTWLGVAAMVAPGCTTTEQGDQCVGGVLDGDGDCVAKCDVSLCAADNVCVGNACRLQCDSHTDCFAQTQACAARESDDGETVFVCVETGQQPVVDGSGFAFGGWGQGCQLNVVDQCTATACPNGLPCDPAACGGNPAACVLDEAACGENTNCNIGKCDGTGTRCVVTTCPAEQCTKFQCLTDGEGDPDAYCTHYDCTSDDHCAAGYECGLTRDPRPLCDQPSAGNIGGTPFCGATGGETCVASTDLTANGAALSVGELCLQRGTCLKRTKGSPCTSHMDCSLVLGGAHLCAPTPSGDESVCGSICLDDSSCTPDEQCLPTGQSTCARTPAIPCTAGTDCPREGDTCEPRSVCMPRSGSWQAGGFCNKCRNDVDCADDDPNSRMACGLATDGQAACLDQSFPHECPNGTDAECPPSPSGARGECLDENEQVTPASSVYRHCYYPFSDAVGGFTCWP